MSGQLKLRKWDESSCDVNHHRSIRFGWDEQSKLAGHNSTRTQRTTTAQSTSQQIDDKFQLSSSVNIIRETIQKYPHAQKPKGDERESRRRAIRSELNAEQTVSRERCDMQ